MKAQRAKLKPSTRTERIPDQGYKASHDPSAATGDDDREYVAQNPVTVSLESVRKGCKRTRGSERLAIYRQPLLRRLGLKAWPD